MRTEEEAEHHRTGPAVPVVETGVFHPAHQLDAMLGDVVVQPQVAGLIGRAVVQAHISLVAALGADAAGILSHGVLVTPHDLQLVRQEDAGLEIDPVHTAASTAEAGGGLRHERARSIRDDEGGGEAVAKAVHVRRRPIDVGIDVAQVQSGGVRAQLLAKIPCGGGDVAPTGVELRERIPHAGARGVRKRRCSS